MKTALFAYDLPSELIAQFPPKRRGMTRLLVMDRTTGILTHRQYADIPEFVGPGDVVVLNRTKVMKARVFMQVKRTGKDVEVLFLEQVGVTHEKETWHVLIGRMKHVQVGDTLCVGRFSAEVMARHTSGRGCIVRLVNAERLMSKVGHIPLPPYIARKTDRSDALRYNTVFADRLGSSAAPTASLNLTRSMLKRIQRKGATIAYVTLTVGLGTFLPIDTDEVETFRIHSEHISVPRRTVDLVNRANGRVWAVGTTVVRTLESAAVGVKKIHAFDGKTNLFIYPGYAFKVVDVLVTNFHMPRTSLVALVASFAGRARLLRAYRTAIKEGYQFLSYGDSMLIGDISGLLNK